MSPQPVASATTPEARTETGARLGRARRSAGRAALPLAILATLGLLTVSLFVGVYDVVGAEGGGEMFFITRVPRTVALMLAGCAIAVSGLVMQMLTQNRFVDATTAGTTEWAALGLLLTVLLVPGASLEAQMVVASLAAFVGTLVFLGILRRVAIRTTLVVPLIGIMLGAVVSAFTTYLAASTNSLQMLGTWFMGSFTSVVRGRYEVLWVVAIVTFLIFLVADRLTVAGLGKDVATTVGVRYEAVLVLGTSLVAVATGVTTVVVGFLPFLGLVVPNIVSMIRGDDLRGNLPWVCVGGVALVTVCDLIGRTIRMPFEIPVSMVLGIVGSVVFIALLLRRPRG
ncbi:ABC transporter permease [Agromyces sp. NPDC058136]|uniref:ABC transporter permease n=1 Tax=Agromyces sp. NPDC058136 TaxID=3346354 RepID=UPI0036DEDED1